MEKTIHISDKELHATLDEFLQESEKKEEPRIWNRTTITGILLLLVASAYTGYSVLIAAGLISNSFPLLYTAMKIAPFAGGALLGVILLGSFRRRGAYKAETTTKMEEKMKTRDKLDEFLYNSEQKEKPNTFTQTAEMPPVQKLFKSRSDRKIFGVCGGLSKYFGISATALRVFFVLALFLSANTFLLVYLALAMIIPKEPETKVYDFF